MHLTRRGFLAASGAATLAAAPTKKIVLVADHASHGFAQHECNAGCLLLAKLLEESVPGVTTAVHRNGWPQEPGALAGAAAVVLYTNGGGGHPALKHMDELEAAVNRGAGLAVLHYGLEVPQQQGQKFLEWLGGYFEVDWSVNPMWTARFMVIPKHAIMRGVKPFAIHDEWYYHMRFRENMQGITPLLSAFPPEATRERPFGPRSGNEAVRARKGMEEVLAWATERPGGGGRGFGFTGGHFHWVWGNDDYRRVVLNGIVWTAGIEVPAHGVASRTPTYEELLQNQDKPVPEGFTREKAAESVRPR